MLLKIFTCMKQLSHVQFSPWEIKTYLLSADVTKKISKMTDSSHLFNVITCPDICYLLGLVFHVFSLLERERDWRAKQILLIHFPNDHNGGRPGWNQEPGTPSRGFHAGAKAPGTCTITCCLQMSISGNLDQKQRCPNSRQHPSLIYRLCKQQQWLNSLVAQHPGP